MDALMEADVNLACTIGVSAGALNGISYVSGQIGRSARSPLRYRHDSRYFGLGAFLRNRTPFGFDFMFGELSRTLDPLDMTRFFRPERRFVAVATNCLTGKPEYFEKGRCPDIMLATRASSTMPYISQMVRMNGTPYLDGGCSCKIPFRWALDNGFRAVVIVKTNPDGLSPRPRGRTQPRPAVLRAEVAGTLRRPGPEQRRLQRAVRRDRKTSAGRPRVRDKPVALHAHRPHGKGSGKARRMVLAGLSRRAGAHARPQGLSGPKERRNGPAQTKNGLQKAPRLPKLSPQQTPHLPKLPRKTGEDKNAESSRRIGSPSF